jgi:GTP-binding protein Era
MKEQKIGGDHMSPKCKSSLKGGEADSNGFKSGFITLIGRPNAGKSTLLNGILGYKISIISDKPQTTRNIIRGIYNDEGCQMIFMDTPGVHKPKHKMGKHMVDSALNALSSGDVILYLADTTSEFGGGEEFILKTLSSSKVPVFLILNKIDILPKEKLLPLMDFYSRKYSFAEIIPLSALNGDNVKRLLEVLKKYLPEGPAYYPLNTRSDQPEQFLLSELLREQLLSRTYDEIPHSAAVVINNITEKSEVLLYVEAIIYVEHDSQKRIVIGKNGALLKEIGSKARAEMEKMLACRVYLRIWVKTKKDWRNNEVLLKDWMREY